MSLRYKIVFSVDILHEYYEGLFCQDLEIVPSPATQALLSGNGMLYKMAGHKLVVLTRTDAHGKAFIKPGANLQLAFYLKLKTPGFNNFTNLAYHPGGAQRYFFSNSNQSKTGTTLYLTSKVANYSNGKQYTIADLAASAQGDVFEAIKPGSGHNLTDANYWMKHGKFQYVNTNDLITVTPFVYLFETAAAKNFAVNVFGFNTAGGNYDKQVTTTVNHTFDTPQNMVPVRLETLQPGKYRIDVNGTSKFIYYDADAMQRDVLGVLEISNHLAGSNDFALFDAAGKPKGKTFTIRFASRAVIWKYLSRSADVTAVEDTAATDKITFSASPGNQFLSDKPVPLKQKPLTTILLRSTSLGDITPLPNPGINRISTVERAGNVYLCSEMYLNY